MFPKNFTLNVKSVQKSGCSFSRTKTKFVPIVRFLGIGLHIPPPPGRIDCGIAGSVCYVDHEKVVKVVGSVTSIMTARLPPCLFGAFEKLWRKFYSARMR